MVRATVKTISYGSGYRNSYKVARSRQLVNKAAQLLRNRVATAPRAPLRTGGYFGSYNRRGRDELKVFDNNDQTTTTSQDGVVILLNGIAQGTDYTQRIGRKVCLRSLLTRFTCILNTGTTASETGDVVRLLIFYDSQTNATTPQVSDVLTSTSFDAQMNLTNRDRFKVVLDKFITMNGYSSTAGALTAGSPVPKMINKYKKMNMDVIFGGTGGTVGSIQTGGLFALIISLNAFQTTTILTTRVRYTDS